MSFFILREITPNAIDPSTAVKQFLSSTPDTKPDCVQVSEIINLMLSGTWSTLSGLELVQLAKSIDGPKDLKRKSPDKEISSDLEMFNNRIGYLQRAIFFHLTESQAWEVIQSKKERMDEIVEFLNELPAYSKAWMMGKLIESKHAIVDQLPDLIPQWIQKYGTKLFEANEEKPLEENRVCKTHATWFLESVNKDPKLKEIIKKELLDVLDDFDLALLTGLDQHLTEVEDREYIDSLKAKLWKYLDKKTLTNDQFEWYFNTSWKSEIIPEIFESKLSSL